MGKDRKSFFHHLGEPCEDCQAHVDNVGAQRSGSFNTHRYVKVTSLNPWLKNLNDVVGRPGSNTEDLQSLRGERAQYGGAVTVGVSGIATADGFNGPNVGSVELLMRKEAAVQNGDLYALATGDRVNQVGPDCGDGLEEILLYVVGAEVPTTTGAVPQLLQRLAGSLVNDCALLVRTVPEFNYAAGVLTPTVQHLFAAAGCGDLLSDFPEHFCVVYLSSFTPNSILTHTLVGHELGHILYDVHNLDSQLTLDYSPFVSELDALVGSDPALEAEFKQLLAQWQEEFGCDLIGLSLLGPAYMYTLIGFLSATGGSSSLDAGTSHPSPRMRITLMLDTIEGKMGVPGFAPDTIQIASHLRNFLNSIPEIPPTPIKSLGFKILEGILPGMVQKSSEVAGAHLYGPERHSRDILELRRRLELAIPPNEYDDTNEPASFAGILNASWDFYLTESDLLAGSELPPTEGKERFYDIVSWALEAAELSQAWRQSSKGI